MASLFAWNDPHVGSTSTSHQNKTSQHNKASRRQPHHQPRFCLWRLDFLDDFHPGNFIVMARSASEARRKMMKAWKETKSQVKTETILEPSGFYKTKSKTPQPIEDNTYPYVSSLDELKDSDEKTKIKVASRDETSLSTLRPSIGCVVKRQSDQSDEWTKFFTIEEVLVHGWIKRVSSHVVLSLALDG